MITKIFSTAVLTFTLLNTSAEAASIPNPLDTIKAFRVGGSGNVLNVFTTNDIINPAGCARDYPGQISQIAGNGVNANAYDQMLSSVMLAKMSSSTVKMWVSDSKCSGNYPSIIYIEVR